MTLREVGYFPSYQLGVECKNNHLSTLEQIIKLLNVRYPSLREEMSLLREALRQWSEALVENEVHKNMELMRMRQETTYLIREDVAMVVEEIGAYLRNAKRELRDPQLCAYYDKYLKAVKRLRWQPRPSHHVSSQVGTDAHQCESHPTKESESMRDAAAMAESMRKQQQTIDCLKAANQQFKNQNEQMELTINLLKDQLLQLQEKMHEIENKEEDYLKQINRLTNQLDECQNDVHTPTSGFKSSHSLQGEVADILQQAQQRIIMKAEQEQQQAEQKTREQFRSKRGKQIHVDYADQIRMLLLQAVTLQEMLFQ